MNDEQFERWMYLLVIAAFIVMSGFIAAYMLLYV